MSSIRYYLKWGLRVIYYPVLHVVYGTSFLSPRRKDCWVFVSHQAHGFAGNCKYFFLYVTQHHGDTIQCIWLTKDKDILYQLRRRGYVAYHYFSIHGLYSLLFSGSIIFDAYLSGVTFWLSGGSRKINLWHGVGIKKSDRDIKKGRLKRLYNAEGIWKLVVKFLVPRVFLNSQVDYFVTTSSTYRNISQSAFGLSEQQIVVTGYPRNDVFFREVEDSDIGVGEKILMKLREGKLQGKKVVLYAPTFRETAVGNFRDTIHRILFELNAFTENQNILFIFKGHTNIGKNINDRELLGLGNVCVLDTSSDIYSILNDVDVLITDYSSIASDFLLLDKPIVFFPYDFAQYTTHDREFYFDYRSHSPGHIVYSTQELILILEKLITGTDEHVIDRRHMRSIYFNYIDGESSKRLFHAVMQQDRLVTSNP